MAIDLMNSPMLIALLIGGAAILSWPIGRYMQWSMDPSAAGVRRSALDRLLLRTVGRRGSQEQGWREYTVAMLAFNAVMFAVTYGIVAVQSILPLNPDGKGPLEASLLFNTIASFTTNTNLQHYAGEVSMSYMTQICALMWLQFVSAATGIAVLTAMARGLAGRTNMGNFWIDVQRAAFFVLLPLSLVFAALFLQGGVPMTLKGAAVASTLEGAEQVIARGPVAAFLAIKQLGTNGGGFFGANCTHPYENPNFWTNLVALLSILLLPMASVWMFGRIVGRMRHATVVFCVMTALVLLKSGGAVWFESEPAGAFAEYAAVVPGSNLEGKELRFGAPEGSGPIWSVLTTSTSNGSVGAMHDSLQPMTGLFGMVGMWLNSAFGGVGVGMVNMFIYILVAVFLAGMMVGRTPEYLNKRVEAREMQLAILTLFSHGFFILVGTAIFAATVWGRGALNNTGPHGFSELLYEFSSASANNGSGFEGLSDNTIPWNMATGIIMLLNRYIPILLPLAIAGSLAAKRKTATSAGTLSVQDATFGLLLFVTIVIIGALTFFPAAVLGPIAEHLTS